jgi:uncharacterized protein YraI
MKKLGMLAVVGCLIAAGSISGKANAQDIATGNVNLRTGPGVGYPQITTIPRGAMVNILGCGASGWCDVVFGYNRGWASGRYLQHMQPKVYSGYPTVSVWGEPRTYRVIRRVPVVIVPPRDYSPIAVPYGYAAPGFMHTYYGGIVGW